MRYNQTQGPVMQNMIGLFFLLLPSAVYKPLSAFGRISGKY
jgi:hypothetical protein